MFEIRYICGRYFGDQNFWMIAISNDERRPDGLFAVFVALNIAYMKGRGLFFYCISASRFRVGIYNAIINAVGGQCLQAREKISHGCFYPLEVLCDIRQGKGGFEIGIKGLGINRECWRQMQASCVQVLQKTTCVKDKGENEQKGQGKFHPIIHIICDLV